MPPFTFYVTLFFGEYFNIGGLLMKKLIQHIFVDGFNGMAFGIFCTYALGTLIQQFGTLLSKDLGDILSTIGGIAIILTGAGIGMGMAIKFQVQLTIAFPAAIAGMVGAYSDYIFQSSVLTSENIVKLSGPGDPLGAFIAALITLELGSLLSGKTDYDLLITPVVCTGLGSASGLLLAPLLDQLMMKIALLFQWGLEQNTVLMGVIVASLMCICSVLPLSTITLAMLLNLKGLAAGAATIGCCCSMVGFAIASYKDNKIPGLFIQGLGTPKVQLSNMIFKPYIILPPLISSGILGAISTGIFKLTNSPNKAGIGTTGYDGCLGIYSSMVEKLGSSQALLIISLMCFVLPGLLSYGIAAGLRKVKLLKDGDMKINI